MIKLLVGNSESSIEGLSMSQQKQLSSLLSYTTQIYSPYKRGTVVKRISLINKKGVFASGLLYMAKHWLETEKIHYEVSSTRHRPESQPRRFSCVLEDIVPYYEQTEAAKVAALKARGCIVMPTGFGKSLTMALLINALQVKTLIVVPNLMLKQQLTSSMRALFGNTQDIIIENIDSANLPNITDCDLVLIDEGHHSAAKTYRNLNKTAWKNTFYRFFFTATPFRGKEEEQLLFESIAGQVIFEVTHEVAVKKGYIVPIEAYYYNLPKTKIKGNSKSWANVYKELVVQNTIRNDKISSILKILRLTEKSTLCLVKEIDHGQELSDRTSIPFVKGENLDNRIKLLEFNLKEHLALIGTTGVLGEGCDTKPCEYIIIAGLGKSKPSLMQQFGRGFRAFNGKESCKVILFRDASHRWTLDHFNAQRKLLLDQFGIVPIKLE